MARYRYGVHTIVACPGRLNDFLEGGQVRLDGVWSPVERQRMSAKLLPAHAVKLIYDNLSCFIRIRLISVDGALKRTSVISWSYNFRDLNLFGLDLEFHGWNA